MKVELHLHTNRYSACAVDTPEAIMARLIETGYDAVFLTEHDAVWSDMELADLQREFPELCIFPGMELTIAPDGSQHLLVLGTNDRTYLRMPDAAEIVTRAREEGHVTVLAHPMRWEGGYRMLNEGIFPDAMEFNTGNHGDDFARASQIEAEALHIRLVNAGDVHSLEMIDRYWIETSGRVEEPEDLADVLHRSAYANCGYDDIRFRISDC